MSKNNAVVPPGLVSWRLDKEDDLLELTAVRRIRRRRTRYTISSIIDRCLSNHNIFEVM
jgi:hypothetical protein